MKRKFNFYAGPATLPREVLEDVASEFTNYAGSGLSIVEMSHRSAEYMAVQEEAIALLRRLLGISDSYEVLLLAGGATLQFSMVPMNFMVDVHGNRSADFVDTGAWAQKAIADAKKFGTARVIWNYAERGGLPIGKSSGASASGGSEENGANALRPNADSSYLHITSNETINGIQWKSFPRPQVEAKGGAPSGSDQPLHQQPEDQHTTEGGSLRPPHQQSPDQKLTIPLVADMSSDILARRIPVDNFSLIYAGAQKNIGPAGVTIVIIRKELLDRCPPELGAYLNYKTHANAKSLYNTPPVFSVWVVGKVLKWIEAQGGVSAMEERNRAKAQILYNAIDASEGFYRSPVNPQFRSDMNIVFTLSDSGREAEFLSGAQAQGLIGLKGHRSVGGFRASLYNAMPIEGAQALANYMAEYMQGFAQGRA